MKSLLMIVLLTTTLDSEARLLGGKSHGGGGVGTIGIGIALYMIVRSRQKK